jgi:hypothetical protein
MPKPALVAPLPRQYAAWAPAWIRGRRGLILLAAVPIVAAAAVGWPWLVAAGVAPLLLAAAPCVAMCALGLCMKGMPGGGSSTATVHDAGGGSIQPGKDKTDA